MLTKVIHGSATNQVAGLMSPEDKQLLTTIGNTYVSTSALNSLLGANSGVATLDASGKIPSSQLPSYVDDVIEAAQVSAFPATGESGKIYVALDTNKTYRWSGSAYVEISESLALGETSSTAYRGDRGKVAYDHAGAKGSAFTSGLYKITTNAEGHVTAATAVVKADITGLGIPAQDTTYQSLAAAENGTDISLVSTGEKYIWNSKADGNHTHNYAGSANAGGPANSALKASTVIDSGNNNKEITISYSKAGLEYKNVTWLAAWNGYELRAIAKNLFTPANTCIPLNTKGGIGECAGGGQYAYATIATINTNTSYVNGAMVLELSGRYIPFTTIQIRFANQEAVDPNLNTFISNYSNAFFIKKTNTSEWTIYCNTGGTWGSMVLHRITGAYSDRITPVMTQTLTALPADCTQVTYAGNVGYALQATADADGNAISSTYLKLSGGTVTGATTIKNILTLYRESSTTDNFPAGILFSTKDTTVSKAYTNAYIYAYHDHSSTNGANMVIHPGGNLFVGSGESAANLYPTYKASTGEDLFITSDGTAYVYANAQTIANRIGFAVTTAGAIVPQKAEAINNNAQNIGASDNKWANVYATTFNGALSGNATSASALTNLGRVTSADVKYGDAKVRAILASSSMTTSKPPTDTTDDGSSTSSDAVMLDLPWDGNTWGGQLAINLRSGTIFCRSLVNGTYGNWKKTLNDYNYTDYTVTKTGTGASGTWAISISGNADTATTADKLTGFSGRSSSMTWGNQTGSVITCFTSASGGAWGFRDNNPASKQLSMTIDGTVYIKEGGVDIGTAVKSFSVSGTTVTYTTLWGNTGTFTTSDTKNTAGSTNSTSKLFLIGATSQAANPTTNSYSKVFATNGALSAKTLGINADTDADKVTLQWNSTDQSVDFVFA